MKIDQYVIELLYTHDCVIIPDFGALKTKYKSAEIDSKGDNLVPPSKTLTFDNKLLASDGLLINYIAEKERITKSEAKEKVFKFVTDSFVKLEQGSRIHMAKIGAFAFDKKRKLVFDPSDSANFLTDTYGMPKLKVIPIEKQQKRAVTPPKVTKEPEKPKTKIQKEEIVKETKKKDNSKYIYIAVAVAIIAAFIFISFQIGLFDTTKEYVAGLISEDKPKQEKVVTKKKENTTKKKQEVKSETDKTEDATKNNTENKKPETNTQNKEEEVKQKEPDTKYVEPKVKADSKKTFYIIAGSFSNMESAAKAREKFRNKGYNSEILERDNGGYRVTLGSYQYKSTALKELEKYRKVEGSSIWMLSK